MPFRPNPPANGWRAGRKGRIVNFRGSSSRSIRNFVAPVGQKCRSELWIEQRVVAALSTADYLPGCRGSGDHAETLATSRRACARDMAGKRSIKRLDNPQPAAAARARGWLVFGFVEVVVIIVVATYRRRVHGEQASAELKFLGAMAVRQEAVVTNTMKAVRQDVEEEAAHKLGSLDAHDFPLVPATLPILLPAEADVGLIEIEQAIIGDRDAMSAARQISQQLLGTGDVFLA